VYVIKNTHLGCSCPSWACCLSPVGQTCWGCVRGVGSAALAATPGKVQRYIHCSISTDRRNAAFLLQQVVVEEALAMINDELDRQPILPGQRSVRDRRAQRQVPVSNLQPSRRPEKAGAAQSRMALRASPRRLALAPPTHPWSIPLAPRGTSGERVGERGFKRTSGASFPRPLLRLAEERESFLWRGPEVCPCDSDFLERFRDVSRSQRSKPAVFR
jgi:hypothetical protein